jgi:DUF4097 and DUF4098 domain-containing protein YvlB
MRSITLFSSITVLAVAAASPAWADEQKTLTLDTQGLQVFNARTGAGALHIQGVPGATKIEVKAEIIAKPDTYRLTLEKQGNSAVLVSDITFPIHWNGDGPRINLTVTVPANLRLDVDDESGEIRIQNMEADAKIDDESGSLRVANHRGALHIDDDSGEIDLRNITGKVDIDDDSGAISVTNVTGDLTIEDESGEIDVRTVSGSVNIEDDSGELTVNDVKGNVTIRDNSGEMTVKTVGGSVTIHDGSGDIVVADVKQGLTIRESGSGGVSMSRIEGGTNVRE